MKINTKRIFALALSIGLLLTIGSCGLAKGKEIGERAVDEFHNQLNAGQYHEIYVQSDEAFRKAVSEPDAVALFEAVRRKLGIVRSSNQTLWHVKTTTEGTLVTLVYDVEFSEGKGTEQFVFHISGESALLFNYNVNSPLFITK